MRDHPSNFKDPVLNKKLYTRYRVLNDSEVKNTILKNSYSLD